MAHPYFTPCPNCHGTNIHIAEWFTDSGETEYYGACDDCGFEDDAHSATEGEAIDQWRHFVSPADAEDEGSF